MKNTKTSQLVLGAVLLAVFLILHILFPGGQKSLQGMMLVVTFLPTAIYCLRCGVGKTLIMVVAGIVLAGLLLPLEVFLSFAIPALLIGLVAGLLYGKRRRLAVILIISTMFLLQNILELLVYSLLMNINLAETYVWFVGLVHDALPDTLLIHPVFKLFLEDFLLSSVPFLAILVSGAKGILSFLIIDVLCERLKSFMGKDIDPEFTKQTAFAGKGISIAYFCVICLCAVVTALPFLSLVPYHFVSAATAAIGIFLAVLYVYYFYIHRVRSEKDHQKRLIHSFLLVITLPLGIFLLPLLEIRLLKERTAE